MALPPEDSEDNFATLAGTGGEVASATQGLGSKGVKPLTWGNFATSPLCRGASALVRQAKPPG